MKTIIHIIYPAVKTATRKLAAFAALLSSPAAATLLVLGVHRVRRSRRRRTPAAEPSTSSVPGTVRSKEARQL